MESRKAKDEDAHAGRLMSRGHNDIIDENDDDDSRRNDLSDGAAVNDDDDESDEKRRIKKVKSWKGISTVLGCLLTHLTLGAFYTYGNFTTYTTSFMRNSSSPGLEYSESFWVTPTIGGCQGLSMYFGGLLGTRFGNRTPILLGAIIMSGANFISAFTIKSSFGFFLFTYGVLQGMGVGLAYASPLKICCEWFPNHKGLINGLIVAGFGSGGAIFNQVITQYLNPGNLKPTQLGEDNKSYFINEQILIKVPKTFLILGSIYLSMQMTGLLLMFEPSRKKGKIAQLFARFKVEKRQRSRCATEYQTIESTLESHPNEPKPLMDDTPLYHQKNYKPKEMLKTWNFWSLYTTFFCNGMGITFMAGYWKIYGQNCHFDDQFLATIGSLSSVANGLGRIMWGKISDKTNYKTTMITLCASNMVLLLTFCATPLVGEWFYGIYVFGIYLAFSGTFSLMPTACARSFGLESMTQNYGLLFSSSVPQNLLSVAISKPLGKVAWFAQFWIIAAHFLVSFFLAMKYPSHTAEGLKI